MTTWILKNDKNEKILYFNTSEPVWYVLQSQYTYTTPKKKPLKVDVSLNFYIELNRHTPMKRQITIISNYHLYKPRKERRLEQDILFIPLSYW